MVFAQKCESGKLLDSMFLPLIKNNLLMFIVYLSIKTNVIILTENQRLQFLEFCNKMKLGYILILLQNNLTILQS